MGAVSGVRSPFQQLSAPVTRLQCHPWSCFFILFLPVSLTGQRKLHFREDFAVKQLLQGLELNQDLPAPGCMFKPSHCWLKRVEVFCPDPRRVSHTPAQSYAGEKGNAHKRRHSWPRCCAERCYVSIQGEMKRVPGGTGLHRTWEC